MFKGASEYETAVASRNCQRTVGHLGNRARELSVSVPGGRRGFPCWHKAKPIDWAWTWLTHLMPRRFQATEKTAMAISTKLAEALARAQRRTTVTGPDRFLGILTALVRSIILPVRVALNNRFAGEISGKNDCTRRPPFGERDSWTLLRAPRKEGNPTKRHWSKGSGNSLKTLILASTESRHALEHQVEL